MGLHNLNPLRIKDSKLSSNICPICQTSEIISVTDEVGRDSFDFICNQCRPSFIISVSGSALNSEYLNKLDDDPFARNELQADIRQYEGSNYPLLIDTLSYFLRIKKEFDYKSFTFSDWHSGQLGSNLNLYENIPSEELEKINSSQEEIFTRNVDKVYEDLLIDLKSRMQRSIRKDELLKYEISSVKLLLHGEIQMSDQTVDLGTFKLPLQEITKIQTYYRDAVNGKLDIHTIVGPNQKTKIGSSFQENRYRTKAVAFEKYLKHLEAKTKKTLNGRTKQQERIEYLKNLYFKCEGNSSSICNISDVGKILNLSEEESRETSHTLMDFGYVEILTKDGAIKITSSGISKIEEFISNDSDITNNKFSTTEIKEINNKIDAIIESLEKLDLGHEVIFEEIDSLRSDAQKLSKKDFKSMALGKLFNLGIDGLLNQDRISEILKDLIGNDFNRYLK